MTCDLSLKDQAFDGVTLGMEPIVDRLIRTLRTQRVILNLAALSGGPTMRFDRAFKRNRNKFPEDFAFHLTACEFAVLKIPGKRNSSQNGMSYGQYIMGESDNDGARGQGRSFKHRGAGYRPWAFTEHGALMAANIRRSPRAAERSLFVIRAFIKRRAEFSANREMLERLAEIDQTLRVHDSALRDLYAQLLPLLMPPAEPAKPKIGFHPR